MKIIFVYLSVLSLFNFTSYCGEKKSVVNDEQLKNRYQLLNEFKLQDEPGFFDVDFTPRRTNAIVFSSLVPGSGQTYLGSELKGMALSIAFYGSALYAVISHNNAMGREDRIKVLTQEYLSKGNYNDAEKLWQSILSEKSERDNDYNRRKIFSLLALGIWAYNIFDILFLTEDEGEKEFSLIDSPFYFTFFTNNDFNGIALNLNLP